MNRKYWLFVLTTALFLCVLVALLLVSRINDARTTFAIASPGAFNYLLQGNRNLGAFVEALRESKDSEADGEEARELRSRYRKRFDVVWGGFSVFDINFQAQPAQQEQVRSFVEDATRYLNDNEHLMAPGYVLSDAELNNLIIGAKSLSGKIVDLGHRYFIYASQLTDLWDEKLNRLYQLFWVCFALLVLTATLLITMLMRSVRRSAELIDKSHRTQREMKNLIDELRSGKLENKAKDSFIAAASHDLRQPLHALGLFLGATEKHIENEAGREALAEAKHCTAELNRLFNSLLDLSRLDAGVVEANKTEFKLDRLLRLMDQEFSGSAKQKGIYLNVSKDAYFVHSDALLLSRILRNLLENAFTHSGATDVQIFCEQMNNKVRLTVADNGSGIPVAEQSDIFSEYYQLENPDRDRSKGLGLGLSIVKRLCEILNITVSLQSQVGTGTMFHLDLPLGNANSKLARKHPVDQISRDQMQEGALVAVIDDDANVRRGMVSILESLKFKAIAAESADQMIQTLRQRGLVPAVLIADYRLLHNQTGDVAIHRVRSALGMDFPAMIITGDTSPGRMKDAASSGFELMHKPVEPEELMLRISRLLHSASEPIARAN